jgi:hypothetical protein
MNTNKISELNEPLRIGTVADGDYIVFDRYGEFQMHGEAERYDDLTFNFVGINLMSTAGSVDMDWDKNAVKFQRLGSVSNSANRVQGSETWVHKYRCSKNASDLIPVEMHFHWLQFNATDKSTIKIRYRITNNGKSYKSNNTDWTELSIITNNGSDVFPFALEVGKDFMLQITCFPLQLVYATISAEVELFFAREDAGTFDTYIKRFDIHAPIDKMGSTEYYANDEIE